MSKEDLLWKEEDEVSSFASLQIETSPSDPYLKNITELFHVLSEEEDQITKNLPNLISKQVQKQDQIDLLEAFSLELKIRNQEKQQLLESLIDRERSKSLEIHQLQMQIKTLKDDVARNAMISKKRKDRVAGYTSALDMYDWVVDIGLITDINKNGWEVEFSQNFWNTLKEDQKILIQPISQSIKIADAQDFSNSQPKNEEIKIEEDLLQISPEKAQSLHSSFALEKCETKAGPGAWDGAVVAVVGLYDKGKTFLLNNLTESFLPSGKKVNTKGLSFKHVHMDSGTKLILLDTAGSYSPVKVINEFSVAEKEATELFLLDMVFELSDYFICVVNDFTSLDQRFLDKITRSLQNSTTKTFREVIVVHNLKDVENKEVIDHIWETQVTQIYGSGSSLKTRVAAISSKTGDLVEKDVNWFKTEFSRHVCLANADSELGEENNPWVFSLLKYWLKAVFVPVNRPISVVETVLSISRVKLTSYYKTPVEVDLIEGEHYLKKIIKCRNMASGENMRLPQLSQDSSGFIMSRPDSFLPSIDIIEDGEYKIFMDVPGLSGDDILLTRQNVITVVQGSRKKPYIEDSDKSRIVKQERKYGDFAMSFKIPEQYERKWKNVEIKDGILAISYKKDEDDK
ncbi:unnamed protein product [Blepharisma stoltei]|uniref:SHSP domain-containing protein n=1 Tax=Blepharisma stoltei TaxID=1481888 RepID=A0AAU9K386_9CILI|nr:unnamed protein product [Blepharisma stoltei]